LIVVLHAALLVRYHRGGGFRVWLGLLLTAAAGWFCTHLVGGFIRCSCRIYLLVTMRHARPWHLGAWLAWGGGLLAKLRLARRLGELLLDSNAADATPANTGGIRVELVGRRRGAPITPTAALAAMLLTGACGPGGPAGARPDGGGDGVRLDGAAAAGRRWAPATGSAGGDRVCEAVRAGCTFAAAPCAAAIADLLRLPGRLTCRPAGPGRWRGPSGRGRLVPARRHSDAAPASDDRRAACRRPVRGAVGAG